MSRRSALCSLRKRGKGKERKSAKLRRPFHKYFLLSLSLSRASSTHRHTHTRFWWKIVADLRGELVQASTKIECVVEPNWLTSGRANALARRERLASYDYVAPTATTLCGAQSESSLSLSLTIEPALTRAAAAAKRLARKSNKRVSVH